MSSSVLVLHSMSAFNVQSTISSARQRITCWAVVACHMSYLYSNHPACKREQNVACPSLAWQAGVVLFKHHDPLQFDLEQLQDLVGCLGGWVGGAD